MGGSWVSFQEVTWPAQLRDLPTVMWPVPGCLLILFPLAAYFWQHPFFPPRWFNSVFHLDIEFPLSAFCQRGLTPLLIPRAPPPPPPPLSWGLNPQSVPAGSLNYSAERCCSAVRLWSKEQPDSTMAAGERAAGAAEWRQQMSVWELPRKPHTHLPQTPPLPVWQP